MTVVAKLARVSALARSESLGDFRYGQIGQLLIEWPNMPIILFEIEAEIVILLE